MPWTYQYSEALGMKFAFREADAGVEVMTEDKTRYSPEEVSIIAKTLGEITPEIHRVKRIFGGLVVDPKSLNESNESQKLFHKGIDV